MSAQQQELYAELQASIKRITSACRQLLLGLLDDNAVSDEQVSLLYTGVVKAYYQTLEDFNTAGISVKEFNGFPDHLRDALEQVFEQAYAPPPDASVHGSDGRDVNTPPPHPYQQLDDQHPDADVSGEEINLLITRLVKGLQEKARLVLIPAKDLSCPPSPSAGPLTHPIEHAPPTAVDSVGPLPSSAPVGLVDHFDALIRNRRNSRRGSRTSSAGSRTESPARSRSRRRSSGALTPIGSASPRPALSRSSGEVMQNGVRAAGKVSKVYLQIGHEVKRVKYAKEIVDLDSLRQLFVRKFQYIPPADATQFPKIYIKDTSAQVLYELEDVADVYDGCLLQLQAPISVPSSPVPGASSALPSAPGSPTGGSNTTSSFPTLSARRPRQSIAVLQKKLTAVRTLRADLRVLRDEIMAHRVYMGDHIRVISDQIANATKYATLRQSEHDEEEDPSESNTASPTTPVERALLDNVPQKHINKGSSRRILRTAKRTLDAKMNGVDERVADLFDLVEQMRLDMVQRSAVPSRAALDFATAECSELQALVESTGTEIDGVRPLWKLTWERELKRVVAEQQFLDGIEGTLDAALQRIDSVDKLVKQLGRVVAIAQTNPSAVIPRKGVPERFLTGAHGDPGDHEGFDGLRSVIAELGAIMDAEEASRASDRRLRAARRLERLRAWEREHRKNEFSYELRLFLGLETPSSPEDMAHPKGGRLRNTGGVEALELKRAERDRRILAEITKQQNATSSS